MPKGGKRAGAGRPLGAKSASTISKEVARDALRQIVLREMEAMTSAQIAHAKGLKYLVGRHRTTGKFEKLNEQTITKVLSGEDDTYALIEVWDKDPSVQAFTDLMNRALDKPKEQEQEIEHKGEIVMRWKA